MLGDGGALVGVCDGVTGVLNLLLPLVPGSSDGEVLGLHCVGGVVAHDVILIILPFSGGSDGDVLLLVLFDGGALVVV